MSKGFSLNIKEKNIPTFEQEDELYAGESLNVYNFFHIKF